MKSEKTHVHVEDPPRKGWDAAFKAMAECGDDRLIDDSTPTAWDGEELEW